MNRTEHIQFLLDSLRKRIVFKHFGVDVMVTNCESYIPSLFLDVKYTFWLSNGEHIQLGLPRGEACKLK
jgi:hypothetical protein